MALQADRAVNIGHLRAGSVERRRTRIGDVEYLLEIEAGRRTNYVEVRLDGRPLGSLPKPSRRQPWSEMSWVVNGHELRVVIVSHGPSANWKVAILIDGQTAEGDTLRDIRALAPKPMSPFEDWTYVPVTGVAASGLVPSWISSWFLAAVVAIALAVWLRTGVLGAVLYVFGGGSIMFIAIRTWMISVARWRRHLAERTGYSDITKLLTLSLFFVASWLIAFASIVLAILGPAYLSRRF